MYSYSQLIYMDVKEGGLTKKQSVRNRQMDRRYKKAQAKVMAGDEPCCRMERRVVAEQIGMYMRGEY